MYPEHEEQCKVAQYLKYRYPKVLFTISIAGLRMTPMQGKRMKDAGYRKGTCDIFILEPRSGYHSLLIEMKDISKRNVKSAVSPEQCIFISEAIERGFKVVVCYGFDDAQKVLDFYFKGEQK